MIEVLAWPSLRPAICTALGVLGLSWSVLSPAPALGFSDAAQFSAPVLEAGGGGRFYTGSAADGYTCASCHEGASGPDVRIHGFPSEYQAGATYLLRVDWSPRIEHVALMMELTDSVGAGAGRVKLPPEDDYVEDELCDPIDLKLLATQIHPAPDERQIVATPDCGARAAYVQWTAPDLAVGPVHLTGSLLRSNQGGDMDGDGVTPFSLTAYPAGGEPGPADAGCALASSTGSPRAAAGQAVWLVLLGLLLGARQRSLWLALLAVGMQACVAAGDDADSPGRVYRAGGATVEPWVEAQDAAAVPAEGGSADAAGSADAGGGADAETSLAMPQLRFTVTTAPVGGKYAPRNCGAIWVSDSDQAWIRTLKVWAQLRERYLDAYRSANPERDRTDAITSATLRTHETHSVEWGFTDSSGQPLPPGRYHLHLEVTDRDAPGAVLTVPFDVEYGKTDSFSVEDDDWFSDARIELEL